MTGTLVRSKGVLELNVPGLRHPFLLAGGAQGDALAKRADLVGKEIRVTGKLQGPRAGLPPGLTVESLQPAS